jgi:chromosome segregation protein
MEIFVTIPLQRSPGRVSLPVTADSEAPGGWASKTTSHFCLENPPHECLNPCLFACKCEGAASEGASVLKLRKVELLGFKSFCEKTQITFSGAGITCIVGPNGCGKSNIVDAISWVLGEQSHKLLRAERMADCIFNGTAKRPPLGLSEVSLTLVDEELAEAAAKVLERVEEPLVPLAEVPAEPAPEEASPEISAEAPAGEESSLPGKPWKKRAAEKPVLAMKPGEVVIGRRLYRSGQSEYLINGRVARLRDIQELFMGMGLGPDSYAIIEQGRIGQVLNSKPMDRRAIIEEAAGVTMYKTKRRLAEAKLEAAKLNLSRVNDILVEVEKQLASLKRQASKARRYAELREEMRGLLRAVLASKALQLDREAERLESALREMSSAEDREVRGVRELETEQERLSSRSYELDAELRRTQNLLSQSALELDRAENRITFNREQAAQLETRAGKLSEEAAQTETQTADLDVRARAHQEAVTALREQAATLESTVKASLDSATAGAAELGMLEARIEELRLAAGRLSEDSVRAQAELQQAQEALSRHTAAEAQRDDVRKQLEAECAAQEQRAESAEALFQQAEGRARTLEEEVRSAQAYFAALRRSQQETSQQIEHTREGLSAARARRISLEQILNDRAYTAEAVQKLFAAKGESELHGFRAVGLLADYAEVAEPYEGAVEQFLRDELEYVVVETFDHARAGIALLREEVGGRATFFVDSLRHLALPAEEASIPFGDEKGVVARLDRLVDFRDPLGPAAKHFLPKLRAAFLIETADVAERLARENPQHHFLTLDGTCYHGRMVSGGRPGEAGPLALKRELRMHEADATRLERDVEKLQNQMAGIEDEVRAAEARIAAAAAGHLEAEKALVAATHQREQARSERTRAQQQLGYCSDEIAHIRHEAEEARRRAAETQRQQVAALQERAAAEAEGAAAAERLAGLKQEMLTRHEQLATRREELAVMAERLASAEALDRRLAEEASQSRERAGSLRAQLSALATEKDGLEASTREQRQLAESFRAEKARLESQNVELEKEWETLRARTGDIEETLRTRRQSLEELRGSRSQREIEKARNDADRDYLRQTCAAEVNAQPEELMAQQSDLLSGEELAPAEARYAGMKERIESMGPVNMMALEEYQECEQREGFLSRERDDLVQSIENTRLAIAELEEVSRQKFEQAFAIINRSFDEAFRALFGGGTGEMRLTEPDSSGDAGIDIVAQPPGKRLQNVLLLSGGEKALTALALLIAVFRYQPSPFCILDEVDAPLDEANVGRFNRMLAEMGEQTQFIVVTHNRKTMEMGSVMYGVTMQEPGVSKIVSVRWDEPAARAASNAA